MAPETDMINGANELLNPLSQKIRPLLEAICDQLLEKAIRIGFALGTGCETAAIVLSTKPDDIRAQQTTQSIKMYWSNFDEDVRIANLPTAITARLQQISPEFRTVEELRAFRDKCYEFWIMVHVSTYP